MIAPLLQLAILFGAAAAHAQAQPAPAILVDQFGYRSISQKVAVFRCPIKGFDKRTCVPPSGAFEVRREPSGEIVHKGQVTVWGGGAIDEVSGDKVWWGDFSALARPGRYRVVDAGTAQRSDVFRIDDGVYRVVLEQAVRTFFYQRAGFEKAARFAGDAWADRASHVGPHQDKSARLFSAKGDAKTARDLHGGWYDAGDYNKYTSWAASYVIGLLRAYADAPSAFTDKTQIPESGNQVPDILDEAIWGIDWLKRMQNPDGSVLSIVGLDHASPPSEARGPSYYGPANTIATVTTAAALGYASAVLRANPAWRLEAYADSLLAAAIRAYDWAEKHPNVQFRNNDAAFGSQGLGAGQQETDDYGRAMGRLTAAYHLFVATGKERYRQDLEGLLTQSHLLQWQTATPYDQSVQEILLEYALSGRASKPAKERIAAGFRNGIDGASFMGAVSRKPDAYRSYVKDYHWGSNQTKAQHGVVFLNAARFRAGNAAPAELEAAAEDYLHYVHGVNPMGLVYLTNMEGFGATRSLRRIYHSWFSDGSARWGAVTGKAPGPASGFLAGGPNPSYKLDGCCPSQCGGLMNNRGCDPTGLHPPLGQPPAKSYLDFNAPWPKNSWEVTENSNGYQTFYIRLLARFAQ